MGRGGDPESLRSREAKGRGGEQANGNPALEVVQGERAIG